MLFKSAESEPRFTVRIRYKRRFILIIFPFLNAYCTLSYNIFILCDDTDV